MSRKLGRRCKCGSAPLPGQSWCRGCRTEYQRNYRRRKGGAAALSPEARAKANARSYLHCYLKRGIIKKGPCAVAGCTDETNGHHFDYSRPLAVIWLCKRHHEDVHAILNGRTLLNSPVTSEFVREQRQLAAKTPKRHVRPHAFKGTARCKCGGRRARGEGVCEKCRSGQQAKVTPEVNNKHDRLNG